MHGSKVRTFCALKERKKEVNTCGNTKIRKTLGLTYWNLVFPQVVLNLVFPQVLI